MKFIRFLLFPITIFYWLTTSFRNLCYDRGIFKTYIIPIKSICVGNLSLGGTGKSPLTAYLAENLLPEYKIQILSRGYGRKTKGFLHLDKNSNADLVGDEPLMYFKRFSQKNEGEKISTEKR